ncbi:hypothetical protein NDU88_003120 [Pleurodeles waltl]|uniref:Uncharacterized protein n=1 Tax=Pleurodeles waltl TaxID=8319 RepID=A0AAV7V0U3_PLEWA|nr:hypothetical protein NDU88_003120 [Pleurodeles waltl]
MFVPTRPDHASEPYTPHPALLTRNILETSYCLGPATSRVDSAGDPAVRSDNNVAQDKMPRGSGNRSGRAGAATGSLCSAPAEASVK